METGKRYLTENYIDVLQDKRIVSFLSGLFAGGVAAILTHPFDVIKTRKQVFAYSTGMHTYSLCKMPCELDTCVL